MSPKEPPVVLAHVLQADVEGDVLRAMSARERRYVLYYLLEHDRVSVDRLADVLAGWTAAVEGRPITDRERRAMATSLYHDHLPHLDDAGLVEFDSVAQAACDLSLSDAERDLVEVTYVAEHGGAEVA